MRKRLVNVKVLLLFGPGFAAKRQLAVGELFPSYQSAILDTGLEIVMKFKIIVHEAEEGGFWAQVPSIPGCASQGDTMEELLANVREAIEGCLAVDVDPEIGSDEGRILEIAV